MKLAADLDMPGGDAKAQEIWLKMVTALQKTDADYIAPGGVPGGIDLRYHAMEWGDDPNQKLSQPLPGYWRELDPAGNPLAKGAVLAQDQGPAAHAVGVAEARFRAAQTTKP